MPGFRSTMSHVCFWGRLGASRRRISSRPSQQARWVDEAVGIDLPQRPGLTMFTLVLSYLVTFFRNQATRLFLVAALRSKLILGTIRNFTYRQGDGSDTWRGCNAQAYRMYLTDLRHRRCTQNSDSGFLSLQRRSGPQQVQLSHPASATSPHASHRHIRPCWSSPRVKRPPRV